MHPMNIEGSYNIRDLGGFPTNDGHFTRRNILIRSGNLDTVTPTGQQQFINRGVKTIIDLRDEWETKDFPNVFAQSSTIMYLNLPLIGSKHVDDEKFHAAVKAYSSLQELYCKYLDLCQLQVGTIIAAIVESAHTTVFHCYAGKDRTGIIAGLLLSAVGVTASSIAQDYAQTAQEITHLVTHWRDYALQHEQDIEHFERDWAAEPETMLDTLDYLRTHYGGVTNYLSTCGITYSQLERLQRQFII
jgi:protein-tyrosine phosphatase